jgi:hypothetical protein
LLARLGGVSGELGSVGSRRPTPGRDLTGAIGRVSSSLCRLASPFGCEMLVLGGAAFPGPAVPLGMLFRESRAVVERLGRPLVDRR